MSSAQGTLDMGGGPALAELKKAWLYRIPGWSILSDRVCRHLAERRGPLAVNTKKEKSPGVEERRSPLCLTTN